MNFDDEIKKILGNAGVKNNTSNESLKSLNENYNDLDDADKEIIDCIKECEENDYSDNDIIELYRLCINYESSLDDIADDFYRELVERAEEDEDNYQHRSLGPNDRNSEGEYVYDTLSDNANDYLRDDIKKAFETYGSPTLSEFLNHLLELCEEYYAENYGDSENDDEEEIIQQTPIEEPQGFNPESIETIDETFNPEVVENEYIKDIYDIVVENPNRLYNDTLNELFRYCDNCDYEPIEEYYREVYDEIINDYINDSDNWIEEVDWEETNEYCYNLGIETLVYQYGYTNMKEDFVINVKGEFDPTDFDEDEDEDDEDDNDTSWQYNVGDKVKFKDASDIFTIKSIDNFNVLISNSANPSLVFNKERFENEFEPVNDNDGVSEIDESVNDILESDGIQLNENDEDKVDRINLLYDIYNKILELIYKTSHSSKESVVLSAYILYNMIEKLSGETYIEEQLLETNLKLFDKIMDNTIADENIPDNETYYANLDRYFNSDAFAKYCILVLVYVDNLKDLLPELKKSFSNDIEKYLYDKREEDNYDGESEIDESVNPFNFSIGDEVKEKRTGQIWTIKRIYPKFVYIETYINGMQKLGNDVYKEDFDKEYEIYKYYGEDQIDEAEDNKKESSFEKMLRLHKEHPTTDIRDIANKVADGNIEKYIGLMKQYYEKFEE